MATEILLNALVVTAVINAVISARFDTDRRRDLVAEYGLAFVLTRIPIALVLIGLWTTLAVSTGHWQFAALVIIPTLVVIGSMASKPKATQ